MTWQNEEGNVEVMRRNGMRFDKEIDRLQHRE